uniref:sulfotransferase family 2 domain-containing protein n=1 Tax=Roseicyclus sp. TaxID=1914329 RepID=UPI003F6CA7DF
MPLVFIQGSLIYFAHVPRCGGTAVENYLHARFGRLALLDRQFNNLTAAQKWSKTSPQHLEVQALDRIIPRSWIALSFAVVRHPVTRIASVFRFQRDIEQSIPAGRDFSDWVCDLANSLGERPHQFDNHARPASDLVPSDAVIFRLEDGLSRIVEWLDNIEGASRGPREVAAANVL